MANDKELQVILKAKELAKHTFTLTCNINQGWQDDRKEVLRKIQRMEKSRLTWQL